MRRNYIKIENITYVTPFVAYMKCQRMASQLLVKMLYCFVSLALERNAKKNLLIYFKTELVEEYQEK